MMPTKILSLVSKCFKNIKYNLKKTIVSKKKKQCKKFGKGFNYHVPNTKIFIIFFLINHVDWKNNN